MVNNGNFTLLLTSSCQEWQLTDLPWDLPADLPPNASWDIYYGMYLAAIFILQEKVGISCYFCIIRVINSQLAWYSHVRCNPLNTPKTLPHDNYKFQLWGLIFVICHIGVKVDLGKSPNRCTPTHPQMHHGINIMGCIWQPFWILQERVGISFLFWIMRVVNS